MAQFEFFDLHKQISYYKLYFKLLFVFQFSVFALTKGQNLKSQLYTLHYGKEHIYYVHHVNPCCSNHIFSLLTIAKKTFKKVLSELDLLVVNFFSGCYSGITVSLCYNIGLLHAFDVTISISCWCYQHNDCLTLRGRSQKLLLLAQRLVYQFTW